MDFKFMLLILEIILVHVALNTDAAVESVEKYLVANLTSSYDVNARPVSNAAEAVAVQVSIGLQQIIDMDEPTQVLKTNVYLRIYWSDVALQWEPAEHNNITSVRLSVNRIWKPDITLYNDVGTDRRDAESLYPAIVDYDGTVKWLAPTIFTSSCVLNMSPFIENGEWELEAMPAELISALYPCCVYPYESIVFTIKIARKPMFYVINIVLPCAFVSFVGLLAFVLPPTSGEKVSLTVTVLLASTVFLLIVAEALPPQSTTVPLVSQYFEGVIFLLSLTAMVTVFVITIHHRGEIHPRPPWLIRLIFLKGLSRLVCMHSLVGYTKSSKPPMKKRGSKIVSGINGSSRVYKIEQPQMVQSKKTEKHVEDFAVNDFTDISEHNTMDNSTEEIYPEIPNFRQNTSDICSVESVSMREWVLVAMVLDRLFLIIFFLATVGVSLGILLNRNL